MMRLALSQAMQVDASFDLGASTGDLAQLPLIKVGKRRRDARRPGLGGSLG